MTQDNGNETIKTRDAQAFKSPRERARKTKYPGVYQLQKGRFVVRGRVTDPKTARRLELEKVIEASDARDASVERQRLMAELLAPKRSETNATVTACARSWLSSAKQRNEARSTLENKVQVLESHILPYLGEIRIDRLERSDVRKWIEEVSAKTKSDGQPYARDSVWGWWRQLNALVTWAVEEFELDANPCSAIRVQKYMNKGLRIGVQSTKGTNALDADEVHRFLEQAKLLWPQHYAMMLIGFSTGMRWSELSALRWSDFKRDTMEIEISETQWRGTRRARTKSGQARRVAFNETMWNAMQEHRKQLVADQAPGVESGLCFPSQEGGPRCASAMDKPFKRICLEASITKKLSTKVFRRTFVDLARRAGVDEIVRRACVGHASARMQDVYSSVGPLERGQALDKVMVMMKVPA